MSNIYQNRIASTVDIVQKSIDYLQKNKMKISIQSIIDVSHQISKGGISKSALLTNKEAYFLYLKHRNWQPKIKNLYTPIQKVSLEDNTRRSNRREYLAKFRKKDLIQHIVELEVSLLQLQKDYLKLQFEAMKDFSTDFVNKAVDN